MKSIWWKTTSTCGGYLLGLILFLIATCGSQSEGIVSSSAGRNSRNPSPRTLVREFWQAALEGDEAAVSRMVTRIPSSFRLFCVKTPRQIEREAAAEKRPMIELPQGYREEKQVSSQDISGQYTFRDQIDRWSELASVFITARGLYVSRQNGGGTEIVAVRGETILGNEATIDVEFEVGEGYRLSDRFYFSKDKYGWKLFAIYPTPPVVDSGNQYYARRRPRCRS